MMKCNVTLESLYFFDLNRRSRSRSKRRSHSRSRRRSKSPRRRRSYSRERGRRSRSRSLCHCREWNCNYMPRSPPARTIRPIPTPSCQHWRPRSLSSTGTGGGRRRQRKGQRHPPRVTAAPAGLEVPLGEWNLVPVWNIHFFFSLPDWFKCQQSGMKIHSKIQGKLIFCFCDEFLSQETQTKPHRLPVP